MPKTNKLRTLCSEYAIHILNSLRASPKRFVDLSKSCPNEKTRSKLLKELKLYGIVDIVALRTNKRYFVHYKLTKKGRIAHKKISELKTILGSN